MRSEKERRAIAVAVKLEEERKAGENARLAKAIQHRAIQQQQKQIAQEVPFSLQQSATVTSGSGIASFLCLPAIDTLCRHVRKVKAR